jgi:hypothetical protein
MKEINDSKPQMLEILNIVDEWQKTYHFDKGIIVFQNKENLTNIRFDNNSLHEISKHPRGVENLPETLMNPDEIWSRWGDQKQLVVLRNYIKFGSNGNYVVQTKDGIVINGIFVVNSLIDRFRKGLILIR